MEYGKKLYELRKQKSISQEEVANKLGVSRQSVSLWETNQASPSMENLISFAKLFNISLDELVGLKENKKTVNKTKSLYACDYIEDKNTMYRRDYMYINSISHFIVSQTSIFLLTFGFISFIRASSLEIERAKVLLTIGFVSILLGLLVYALYIYINIKTRLINKNEIHLEFCVDEILITCTNCKQKSVSYEMMDYYIDKKDYVVIYTLKGERFYAPKQNMNGFDEFLSGQIERRKSKKPFWK